MTVDDFSRYTWNFSNGGGEKKNSSPTTFSRSVVCVHPSPMNFPIKIS